MGLIGEAAEQPVLSSKGLTWENQDKWCLPGVDKEVSLGSPSPASAQQRWVQDTGPVRLLFAVPACLPVVGWMGSTVQRSKCSSAISKSAMGFYFLPECLCLSN